VVVLVFVMATQGKKRKQLTRGQTARPSRSSPLHPSPTTGMIIPEAAASCGNGGGGIIIGGRKQEGEIEGATDQFSCLGS